MTWCPYLFISLPPLLFCSEWVYVWQISWEQVKYKSTVVLTSHSLWFPFGPIPCNQSFLDSPPSISFLFVVFFNAGDVYKKTCEVPELICCTSQTHIKWYLLWSSLPCISLCLVSSSVKLTYSFNDNMCRLSEYCCWQLAAEALVGGRVPSLFFHLHSYQLDQWNCLMWTCVSPAYSLLQGTNAHMHTEWARERLFQIPQRAGR